MPKMKPVGICGQEPRPWLLCEQFTLTACPYPLPPITVEQLHQRLAKNHPRLFAARSQDYALDPVASPHNPPDVEYRGERCIRCGTAASAELPRGLGPECAGIHPA